MPCEETIRLLWIIKNSEKCNLALRQEHLKQAVCSYVSEQIHQKLYSYFTQQDSLLPLI